MSTNKLPLLSLAMLTVTAVMLAIIVTISGPRISSTNLVEDPKNQRYTLNFSTEITEPPSDITIEPAISFDFNYSQNKVIIQFSEPLRHNTTYTVSMRAKDVRGKSSAVSSTFTTRQLHGYYMQRDPLGDDTIYKLDMDKTESKIIYQAETITSYALSKDSIGVIINEAQDVVIVKNNKTQTVPLPEGNSIRFIDGSSSTDTYVFSLINNTDFTASIWRYDATTKKLDRIKNETGSDIETFEVYFAPDGVSIVYADTSRSLILDNPSDDRPSVNFGLFDSFSRLLPNEKGIFGYSKNTPTLIRADNGSIVELRPEVRGGAQAVAFQDMETFAYLTQSLQPGTKELFQSLIINGGDETVITSHNVQEKLILDLSISPDDGYIVYESANQPIIYDKTLYNGKPGNNETYIIDTQSNKTIKKINGFDVRWRYEE